MTACYRKKSDASIIAQIVAKWTGIPVTKMLETEAEKAASSRNRAQWQGHWAKQCHYQSE